MAPVDWSFIILAKKKGFKIMAYFGPFFETPNSSHKKIFNQKTFLIYLKSTAKMLENVERKEEIQFPSIRTTLGIILYQNLLMTVDIPMRFSFEKFVACLDSFPFYENKI